MTPPGFTTVYIAGSGAIGALVAAGACRAKARYAMVPRTPVSSSIDVHAGNGAVTLTSFTAHPLATTPQDCLILPLKAYQLASALSSWQPYLHQDTPVLLLHNGMGGYETARRILPAKQPVYVATTSHGALKTDPETVIHTGVGHTMLGKLDKATLPDLDSRMMHTLSTFLPPVTWRHDMHRALWHKLAINAAINPLTALHNVVNGNLLYKGYREELQALCAETVAVAASCDVFFSTPELLEDVLNVAMNTAKNYSSMHQDYHQGRKTEIDAINGYIVETGRKKGINASRHAFLVEQIKQR
ncbi:ketopantoate reductase family protein [Alteromonas halophila]|uniref:2-dehydropantoate 2-reductase n=1 Tax=Alteromonas halophila TaxID=516698 RepID=A0A918JG13_9ALTE|nr:2-dehydropantoate 2-reductase [Alteromonas halophila]GGW74188.1 2-dehydropantoate 2-reductase [Alteromonas halophila]